MAVALLSIIKQITKHIDKLIRAVTGKYPTFGLHEMPLLFVIRRLNWCHGQFRLVSLAKWLEEKSKVLSTNAYTISDIFQFSEHIKNIPVYDDHHILVSYDVTAQLTNVPAHETIGIFADKALAGNWFNNTYYDTL